MVGRPKGLPKTGGRKPGTPNKVSNAVKELASAHGPEAIRTLVTLMKSADSDATRVSAAKEILDRAYGKATQIVGGDEEGGPVKFIIELGRAG